MAPDVDIRERLRRLEEAAAFGERAGEELGAEVRELGRRVTEALRRLEALERRLQGLSAREAGGRGPGGGEPSDGPI